jgi:orotidine-5'-phosphate decarboxylase
MVVAVTVLTSLERRSLEEIGVQSSLEEQVIRLARLAEQCGMDGAVCSPQEISSLRQAVGRDFKLVTPGIRMRDQSLNDQQRIATPADAIRAGADYIVVGRAVTAEPNPRTALERLLGTL